MDKQMDKQNEDCIVTISKAGKNLFARVPDDQRSKINYRDKVKIVVIEKALKWDFGKKEIRAFLKNPNGVKLKGECMGYPIEIPISCIVANMPMAKAIELFFDALCE